MVKPLVLLELAELQETPATVLDHNQFLSSGKCTGRLTNAPEALSQYTNGERLNLIVVPFMQLDRLLRNRSTSLVIENTFAKEAGLLMSVQDAEVSSFTSLPAVADEEEVDESEDDEDGQTAERDSRGNRWPIGLVFALVELCPLIKKAENYKAVVDLAAKTFSLASTRNGVYCDETGHGTLPELPHPSTMRRWQLKLDLYSMLFRRLQFEEGHFERAFMYVCSDGSPQASYDYLVTKMSAAWINIPPEGCADPLAQIDVQQYLLPLATCGQGRSKVEDKLVRIIRKLKLETPPVRLTELRVSVRSCYSDQAAEKGMWSAPNLTGDDLSAMRSELETAAPHGNSCYDSASSYLFPLAWEHPGPHLPWNYIGLPVLLSRDLHSQLFRRLR